MEKRRRSNDGQKCVQIAVRERSGLLSGVR